MRSRPTVETRRFRGRTKGQEALRRAAVRDRAGAIVATVLDALEGLDRGMAFEVAREVIRGLTRHLSALGDAARALGVLGGCATDIAPAFTPDADPARAAADALFDRSAA